MNLLLLQVGPEKLTRGVFVTVHGWFRTLNSKSTEAWARPSSTHRFDDHYSLPLPQVVAASTAAGRSYVIKGKQPNTQTHLAVAL